MATIIGSEYLIGLGLLAKLKKGKNSISFAELSRLIRKVQNGLDNLNVTALVIDCDLQNTIEQFSEYFQTVELNNMLYAKCKAGIEANDLESRFMGYIPFDVLKVIVNLIED